MAKRQTMVRKMESNPEQLKKLQKLGEITHASAEYGDGQFVLNTDGIAPAGIQISYKGTLTIHNHISEYEYYVGKDTIIIVSFGKEVPYSPRLFTYNGGFIAIKVSVADWNGSMIQCVPSNLRQKQTWGNWGGTQDVSVGGKTRSLKKSTDNFVSPETWGNLGSTWSQYGTNRGGGKGPRKSR